jgi:hypothetical protein
VLPRLLHHGTGAHGKHLLLDVELAQPAAGGSGGVLRAWPCSRRAGVHQGRQVCTKAGSGSSPADRSTRAQHQAAHTPARAASHAAATSVCISPGQGRQQVAAAAAWLQRPVAVAATPCLHPSGCCIMSDPCQDACSITRFLQGHRLHMILPSAPLTGPPGPAGRPRAPAARPCGGCGTP